MILAIGGDFHFAKSDPFRLHDLKKEYFSEFIKVCKEKADYTVINGDFEDIAGFDVSLQIELANLLSGFGRRSDSLIWVLGNHAISRLKDTPMSPFILGTNLNVKGVITVGQEPVDFGKFVVQGWNENPIPIFERDAYISHRFIVYDKMPKVIQEKKPNELKAQDLQKLPYKILVFNDVHERINEGKVSSLGVGFASDFKDVNQISGYGILECIGNDVKLTRYDFVGYPVFKKFVLKPDSDYPDESEVKGNVVRVELDGPSAWATVELKRAVEKELDAMQPHYREVKFVNTQAAKLQVAVSADLKSTEAALQEFMQERLWSESMKKIYAEAK